MNTLTEELGVFGLGSAPYLSKGVANVREFRLELGRSGTRPIEMAVTSALFDVGAEMRQSHRTDAEGAALQAMGLAKDAIA